MIQSFRNKPLKRFFELGQTKGLPPKFVKKIEAVLDALDSAYTIEELDLPGFGVHPLSGDQAGRWSILITRNWRITFRFVEAPGETMESEDFGAYEVDYEDYH